MSDRTSTKTVNARVASHVPGRIRFKLHPHCRGRETMDAIQQKLSLLEGVFDVRLNYDCGSVTMRYDKGRHPMSGMLGILEDLDVVVESIGHLPAIGENADSAVSDGYTPEFITAIDDLNRRITQVTGLPINLKLALPLAFAGAGIWSIGKKGLMIETMPGWLFMWLALDIFVKLHPARHRRS